MSVLAVVAVLASTVATPIEAQDVGSDARARVLFLEGRAAYEREDYRAAIERFEESYRLSHRPTLMRNIARAWRRLGNDARARSALERYLAIESSGPDRVAAERELAELGPAPRIERGPLAPAPPRPDRTPNEVRADSIRPLVASTRVAAARVAPATTRPARVVAASLVPSPVIAAAPIEPRVPSLPASAELPERPDEASGLFEGRIWTFVAGAAAGVSGLVGGGLYLDAYGRYEALVDTCGANGDCTDGAISRVESSLLAAEIAFGVAATALVGAIVLYFVEAP
jgi:tetratricopeptide (TPR) repeat protein